MSSVMSWEEVGKHNSASDCWVVIDSVVYDVTKFLNAHPGGRGPLLEYAGKDATEAFFELHKKDVLYKYGPKLKKGVVEGAKPLLSLTPSGEIDPVTPYAENWADLPEWKSPFYKPSHLKFRQAVRKFFEEHVKGEAERMDEQGADPDDETFSLLGKNGILACKIGKPVMPYLKYMPEIKLLGDLNPKDFDYFHELIVHSENTTLGSPGYSDGLGSGMLIGLPPVVFFAADALRMQIVPEVLKGEKRICLAISEAGAGSDVANIKTTARLSDDGQHYIVNGHKKWITGGSVSRYFTTCVRTGGPGPKGLSLVVMERTEGLTTSKMKTSYSPAAGTALVIMENVKVPKTNLLGKEGDGFKMIMFNFNHERWVIALACVPAMRTIVADCYRWAMQRKVFGKRLVDQPVIRFKLAQMTAILESCQSWLDAVTYQMNEMPFEQQNQKLAGPIALLKYHCTRSLLAICDHGAQVFGGRAITRTGMGANLERTMRGVKIPAVYGGSEEILADLAVRQAVVQADQAIAKNPALKFYPKL